MKKFLIYLLFISAIFSQNRNLGRNIDQFKISTFTRPLESGLVEVMCFVKIPNYSLQFVKEGRNFIAEYDASLSVTDKEDIEVATGSFSDKIIVKKFSQTTSRVKSTILSSSFIVPLKDYIVSVNIKDIDTKLTSKKTKKVDLEEFSNTFQVYEPIFLKETEGEWGFSDNEFPIDSSQIIIKENQLKFYQYATISPGEYDMVINVFSGKKLQWTNTINSSSENKVISHLINLPTKDINKVDLKIEITVNQGELSASKSSKFKSRDSFMFGGVGNIDLALSQMVYILTTEERKELKNLKQSEKENFFKKAWARRDPKPETKVNELMDEYYARVQFTEENFSRGTSGGWRSDMGMIFILFGKPDDIQKYSSIQSNYTYETWYYFSIGEEFAFIDDYGFGDYRLRRPFVY
ncbi:MAG: GWxTD domain-containing protein [Candidatus Neomarinimicrobiota bacterium]|nr:GWxTD domain-containing protein [Candidatus Neomarinimicrobiota bacterium]